MKRNLLSFYFPYYRYSLLAIASLFVIIIAQAQGNKGKDGAESISTPGNYIFNRYSSLASTVNAGAISITATDINELSGSYSFTNSANPYTSAPLAKGDLIMIIQVQGADIVTADNATYGSITDYNTTGNYEIKAVFDVSGNTIYICEGLTHAYTASGRSRTQIIRIPRLTDLVVGTGVTLTGLPWNGTVGGVTAIETSGTLRVDGAVSANYIGFRGGIDNKAQSSTHATVPVTLYVTSISTTTASKGESIAGNPNDYTTYLNGNYGRGAPANGGGGGNGHNAGGGGGSNAGTNNLALSWNGTGVKNTSNPSWVTAWNFESPNFASDVSMGGGRGGYTYSAANADALLYGPGNTTWGGDYRQNIGGFGGRPLNYNNNTRLFFGGGGGAGDGNNNAAGDGGRGGGIIYILSNGDILGSGTINANGQNGFDTEAGNNDAAGGAGGAGAIIANVGGTISGVSMYANGGVGGNQLYIPNEAEGTGGGGGGGYIATTSTGFTLQVNGGDNGISYSVQVTEFLPNGGTQGAPGTIITSVFYDIRSCVDFLLPIKLISFTAKLETDLTKLSWSTENESSNSYFEIERSVDGQHFSRIGTQMANADLTGKGNYTFVNNIAGLNQENIYYRLKLIEANRSYRYSDVRVIKRSNEEVKLLAIYPNPVTDQLYLRLPAQWLGKNIRIELFDLAGKKISTYERPSAAPVEGINTNHLQKGYYLIQVSEGRQTSHQKFLKQ